MQPDVEDWASQRRVLLLHPKHFEAGVVEPELIDGQLSVVGEHADGMQALSSGE